MQIIAHLSDMIENEIDQADCYVDSALDVQAEYPDVTNDYVNLAQGNLDRVGMLHNRVAKLIEIERKTNGEPPESMLKVYEYLHKKHISKVADIRRLINEMR